jgi:hypothetical protein
MDARWAVWLEGSSFTDESVGTTILNGPVVEQAALHGLRQQGRDVGLPLVSVIRVEPAQPGVPTVEPR